MGDLPLSRVTISRTSPRDIQQRQVIVRVDDGPKSVLLYGDSVALELPPGRHRLKVHNTLVWKNVDFTLEPGPGVEFTVINHPGRVTLGFLALIGAAPLFLTIERHDSAKPAP